MNSRIIVAFAIALQLAAIHDVAAQAAAAAQDATAAVGAAVVAQEQAVLDAIVKNGHGRLQQGARQRFRLRRCERRHALAAVEDVDACSRHACWGPDGASITR